MSTAPTAGCEMTDALAACARGEQTGLRRVIALEGGRLMGVAQRMLQRSDLAEEAVIAALQSIPLGTCKSWIKRGLDALRRCLS